MSGNSISRPKLFQHLRFAKQINLPKNDAQIAAAVMFCRRHGLSTEQIASICRYFSPGCCIRSRTLIKYFFRLWSLESPPFYRHVNQALSECYVEDAHLLRFILYDYFEMVFDKSLPYLCGMLYRGIHTTEENMLSLMDRVGEQIYFVCFTSTSKNPARAMVCGNLLFEIETLTEQQQSECRIQTNADISTFSEYPEEEEVIYAPLTKFRLLRVTYNVDEMGNMQCTARIREQDASIFFQLFQDKLRLPNRTPFQSGTNMWKTKNDDCFFDVLEYMKSRI
ncbi:unnamed protein product [Rotaria socialis]|uniref:NAD(P)(+)--arginine ADP-ribosyltransferase n=1 Tax=Rotaria socialis TaxID=392032 RepID=A0A820CZ13_9BILA|nr:unnamed protein product [Rotaria socialis]CAF3393044.1 unnamed protein product [Rotaria socialis]CAF3519903.1 unnamed protein product [Rotaria socialis]CAF3663092.1 unnamed protein product [Rotaria socialis]CAF4222142.1 unnamed protein product [Rotaria socialis]